MRLFTDHRFALAVYGAIDVAVSVHKYSLGDKLLGDRPHTRYNNFNIFKGSSAHLLHHPDLDELYPEEPWDYFKYSLTFAFLAILLVYLPDLLGLILWNLANALALFFALRCLQQSSFSVSMTLCSIPGSVPMGNVRVSGLKTSYNGARRF